MNIFVCIKPQTSGADVVYDDDTGQPIRPTNVQMGALDEVSLQGALDFCKQHGGTVTAVSVSGVEAEACLRYCLERGADRALRIEYLQASESLNTAAAARQAAAVICSEGAEVVFCASHSGDIGSGFFPYAMSAAAGYKLVSRVIELDLKGDQLTAVRKLERGWRERYQLELPVVITAEVELARPRHTALLGHRYRRAMAIAVECQDQVVTDTINEDYTAVDEIALSLPQARRRPVSRNKPRGSSLDRLRRKRPTGTAIGDKTGPVRLEGNPEDIGRQLVATIRGWLKSSGDEPSP